MCIRDRYFANARASRAALAEMPDKVTEILRHGATRSSEVGSQTMAEVYSVIGLR